MSPKCYGSTRVSKTRGRGSTPWGFASKYAPVAQSGLEQWSTKPKVGGSNPSGRTTTVEVWCNGNTTDFDSVILGSSPSTSTRQW